MRLRLVTGLALGVVGLTSCSLLTDLSGFSGGVDDCEGGACSDAPSALDARGADGAGEGGDADAAPCVPTDVIDPSLLSDAVALALGGGFSCALRTNATVACWGDNGDDVLGVQSGDRPTAGTVPGLSRIVAITAGLTFACALDADGHAWCWGDNTVGQLGSFPPNAGSHPPSMVKGPGGQPLANVTAIDAGENHVCAIVSGAVWCWGANDMLQLGRTGSASAPAPVASALANPVELAVGGSYACAIADGPTPIAKALYCWGSNGDNQLANTGGNTATPQKIPVSLAAVGTLPVTATGHGHVCARDEKDALWCWGENDFGQLGPNIAPGPASPVPQSIDALGLVRMAAPGDDYTCAVARDGTTRCLGVNAIAQLGNDTIDIVPPDSGPPPAHTAATVVSGLPPVSRIAAGAEHTCAILARSCPDVAGPVMCWGQNAAGELGNGTMKPSRVPVAVLAP